MNSKIERMARYNKTGKRYSTILICLLFLFLMSACSNKTDTLGGDRQNNHTVVVFDEQFVYRSGMTTEELAENFRDDAENILNVEVKGNTVEVYVTDEQREYWKSTREKLLNDVKQQFEALDSRNMFEINDEFSKIKITCDRSMNAESFVTVTVNAMLYCEMYQIFNNDDNTYYVEVEVYDQANGKMVSSGNTNSPLTIKGSDWEGN